MQIPEFVPNELQLAALERIVFFKKVLADRGLKVRMSFELEYDSNLFDISRNRHSREAVTKEARKVFPTLLDNEPDTGQIPEARFGTGPACVHEPEDVAKDIAQFKLHGAAVLEEILGQPVFTEFKPLTGDLVAHVRGLHVNYSVYDKEGHNLFDNAGFRRVQAERMLNLQYHAGLAFIETKPSYDRMYGSDISIGLSFMKGSISLAERKEYNPRNSVRRMPDSPHYYLEDRLSGNDVDPFVATALRLAAVYDTVMLYPQIKDKDMISKDVVDQAWSPGETPAIKHEHDFLIRKKTMGEWARHFKEHADQRSAWPIRKGEFKGLRDLLGDKLYDGILKNYGQSAPQITR